MKTEHLNPGQQDKRLGGPEMPISSNFVRLAIPLIAGFIFLAGCSPREAEGMLDELNGNPEATPTQTTTLPTETATSKETEEGVNAIEIAPLVEESANVIEFDVPLVGPTLVDGEIVDLNFPDIHAPLTLALHPSIMESTVDGDGDIRVPATDLVLNREAWDEQFGEGSAERQMFANLMWAHYNAWKHDQDNKFLSERETVSFEEYLQQISEGVIDGTHQLRVREDADSKLRIPESVATIKPLDPVVILLGYFRNNEPGDPFVGGSTNSFSGDFVYEERTSTLMIVSDVRVTERVIKLNSRGDSGAGEGLVRGSSAAGTVYIMFAQMSFPFENQPFLGDVFTDDELIDLYNSIVLPLYAIEEQPFRVPLDYDLSSD